MGDIIYAIPSIRSMQNYQDKLGFAHSTLYLEPGIIDPMNPSAGYRQNERMTEAQARSLIPLLKSEPGFGEVAIYEQQPIDIDLDLFRKSGFNFGAGHIARYYCYAFKCAPCLYVPWLKAVVPSDRFKGYVLVNRTPRYQNKNISYKFLSDRPNVVFVGYPEEYSRFQKDCRGLPDVQASNALELAQWIAGAKGFIGNQSFCFSIAEALKVPRLLEVYPEAPNVVVSGPFGADAYTQDIFQSHAEDLLCSAL